MASVPKKDSAPLALICIHKSGCMQQMLNYISRGSTRYFQGIVSAKSAVQFVEKFDQKYATGLDKDQRAYRKKNYGQASARLMLHPLQDEDAPTLQWICFLSEGDHPALEEEAILNGDDKRSRLVFDRRFEAIQYTAKGAGKSWTWRMTKDALAVQKQKIIDAIRRPRGDEGEIRQLIMSLYKLPGFHGIRGDVAQLTSLAHGEWQRSWRKGDRCPYVKSRAGGYLRRIPIHEVPLEDVIDRMLAGYKPFAEEWVKTKERKPLAEEWVKTKERKPRRSEKEEARARKIRVARAAKKTPAQLIEMRSGYDWQAAQDGFIPAMIGWAWKRGERERLEKWFRTLDCRSDSERRAEAIFEAEIRAERKAEDALFDPPRDIMQMILSPPLPGI